MALEAALAVRGRRLEEIELVVITHQHVDHLGLASTIVRRSGAEVACLGLLALVAARWDTWVAEDDDAADEQLLRHGVPPVVVEVAPRSDAREPELGEARGGRSALLGRV